MSEAATEYRHFGAPLALGILVLPMIFAWFVLRRGYTNGVRVGAFAYLAVCAAIAFVPR